MRLCCAIVIVLLGAAVFSDAARFSRSRYSSRIRFSYRYRSFRTRYGYSRYGYEHSDHSSDPMSRRLSPSVMGPLYFSYASRYPNYFNYRRSSSPMGEGGGKCSNYLALDNGSYVGAFSCPFLPDEPSNWTRCCGYDKEGFCCDPSYDDSWKYPRLSTVGIALIVCACIVVVGGLAIGLAIFCCLCVKKRSGGTAAPVTSPKGKPFVDPAGKQSQVVGSNPPYPTMEYGTMQQPASDTAAGTAPYPMPPYPPPYSPGSPN